MSNKPIYILFAVLVVLQLSMAYYVVTHPHTAMMVCVDKSTFKGDKL